MAASIRGTGERRVQRPDRRVHPLPAPSRVRVRFVDPASIPAGSRVPAHGAEELRERA